MADLENNRVRFPVYFRQLLTVVFSSSLIVALIAGILLLMVGETTANFDIGFEISAFDGFLVMVGLPILLVTVCVLLSPLSFVIYKLISKGMSRNAPNDV